MTAAQKENIKRFKAVQAEAKKLKAKNKKLTHQEAVKQAWAIMYSKQRKANPKKVGAVKKKAERKLTEKDILKKVHSAKTSSKTLYNKLDKLDEAQHKHMSKLGAIDLNIVGKELLKLDIEINELSNFIRREKLARERNRLKELRATKQQQFKTLKMYLNSIAKFK